MNANLYDLMISSPKAAWRRIKRIGQPPSQGCLPIRDSNNGSLVSDPVAGAKVWRDYFAKLGQSLDYGAQGVTGSSQVEEQEVQQQVQAHYAEDQQSLHTNLG